LAIAIAWIGKNPATFTRFIISFDINQFSKYNAKGKYTIIEAQADRQAAYRS